MNRQALMLVILVAVCTLQGSCSNEQSPNFSTRQGNPNPNPNPGGSPTPTPTPAPQTSCQVTYALTARFSKPRAARDLQRTFYFKTQDDSLSVMTNTCPFITVLSHEDFDFAVGHRVNSAPEANSGDKVRSSTLGPDAVGGGTIELFGISFRGAVMHGEVIAATSAEINFEAHYPLSTLGDTCRFSSDVTEGSFSVESNTPELSTYTLTAATTVFYEDDEDIANCLDVVNRHLNPLE